MSEKLKKYVLEAASDSSEAAFILCTKRPRFRAKIHVFDNFKLMLNFKTTNPTFQVHKLPILLEAIEIEDNFKQNQFVRSFKQMAHWYFFTQIKLKTTSKLPQPTNNSLEM